MSEIIWQMQETTVQVYAGRSRDFEAEFQTAASAIDTPLVAYTHYRAVLLAYGSYDMTGNLSASVTQQYAQSAIITVTNNHLFIDVDLVFLALTGTLIGQGYVLTKTAEDATSIAEYGKRTLDLRAKLALGETETYAMMRYALGFFKNPQPIVQMVLIGKDDTNLTQILNRHISDRVTIVTTRLGMNTEFHIEKEEHTIAKGGLHRVVYMLGKALGARQIAILGKSKLGDGSVLGY